MSEHDALCERERYTHLNAERHTACRCRERVLEAQLAAQAAEIAQYQRLKDAVNQWSSDCLPSCDSLAHDENCPTISTARWLIDQQAKLAAQAAEIARLKVEIDTYDNLVQEDRAAIRDMADVMVLFLHPGEPECRACDIAMKHQAAIARAALRDEAP